MLRKLLTFFNVKNKNQAIRSKEKLARMYAFITWNLFGVVFYLLVSKRMPTDREERRQAMFNLTGSPGNMLVYQAEGFKVKKTFNLKITDNLEEGAAKE